MSPALKPYLVAALGSALLLFGAWVSHLYSAATIVELEGRAATAEARVAALTLARAADTAALAKRDTLRAQALTQAKEARDALSKATAANPAWAAQRVPDGVAAALGVRQPAPATTSP